MERRGFLKGLAAIVGGIALEQAEPLGRVWSFPKEVKCVNFNDGLSIRFIREWYPSENRLIQRFDYALALHNELNAEYKKDFAFMSSADWRTGEIGTVKIISMFDTETNVSSHIST